MSDPVVGFRYYFGIHMGISRGPVDEMVEIKVGDRTAWRGSVKTNSTINIDKPELFGGEDGEGGVQGPLAVMMGGPTQTAPSELGAVLATPMPGFRRAFTVFFNGIVSMMNPYPKPWKFRVRRTLAGWDGAPWYPEKATISLTRPVSSGETQGTSETTVITTAENYLPAVAFGPGYRVALTPPGPVISVDGVRLSFTLGTGESATNYVVDVPAGAISFAGNIVTLVSFDSFDPAIIELTYGSYHYEVSYSVTITTIDPLGGLGDVLIQAMNPIHILWESYTNREWGRGLPALSLDEPTWRAAADTLFGERFGMCIRWNRRDSIKAFQQGILDHVGAVIFPDRATAKIKIKLIRDDYGRGDVPLYDCQANGLLRVSEYAVSTPASMINEVRVVYRDPVTNEDRTVRASNIAGVQSSGGSINSVTREFRGVPTNDLAIRLAKRELRAMSPSIRRFKVVLDRRAYNVVPGGLIRIKDPSRNIPDTVLRIGTVDYGRHGEGEIEVVGTQDVFGLPIKSLVVIPPPIGGGGGGSGGISPGSVVACIPTHRMFELPYRNIYRSLNKADFAFVASDAAYLGCVAKQGQPLNATYQLAVKPGLPDISENPTDTSYACALAVYPLPVVAPNRVQITLTQATSGGPVEMTITVVAGPMTLGDFRLYGSQGEGFIQYGVSLAADIVGSNFYVTDAATAVGSMTLNLNPGWASFGRTPFNLADAVTLQLQFVPSYGAGPWTQVNMTGQGTPTQTFCLNFPSGGRDSSFLEVDAVSGVCS